LRVVFSQTRNFAVIAFTDASMYTTSMTQSNVLKATVPDVWSDSLNLRVLSPLCA